MALSELKGPTFRTPRCRIKLNQATIPPSKAIAILYPIELHDSLSLKNMYKSITKSIEGSTLDDSVKVQRSLCPGVLEYSSTLSTRVLEYSSTAQVLYSSTRVLVLVLEY